MARKKFKTKELGKNALNLFIGVSGAVVAHKGLKALSNLPIFQKKVVEEAAAPTPVSGIKDFNFKTIGMKSAGLILGSALAIMSKNDLAKAAGIGIGIGAATSLADELTASFGLRGKQLGQADEFLNLYEELGAEHLEEELKLGAQHQEKEIRLGDKHQEKDINLGLAELQLA